jgi:hypothetical protein
VGGLGGLECALLQNPIQFVIIDILTLYPFFNNEYKTFCLLVVVALYLDSSYEHPALAKVAFWLCIVIGVVEPSQVCII